MPMKIVLRPVVLSSLKTSNSNPKGHFYVFFVSVLFRLIVINIHQKVKQTITSQCPSKNI